MLTHSFRAMNTSVLLAAEGRGWAQIGMQAARWSIHANEKRFSRFLPASELSRLNRRAGQWVSVSADMFEILRHTRRFYKETEGLFDPSILPDLKRVGYDRTMGEVRARGEDTTPVSPRVERPSFQALELDSSQRRVHLPVGMEIDLGGIAKGWIAECAAGLLSKFVSAGAVNAGGDMIFFGRPPARDGWLVYVEDPLDPTRMLCALTVESGAVATSSVTKRAWCRNGQARHHLIDPRTGESAQTEWQSVTVLAPDLLTAEVYAKVLLIGGPTRANALLARQPRVEYLAVTTDGRFAGTPAILSRVSTLWLENAATLLQGS